MAHIFTLTSPPPTSPDDSPTRIEVHILNAGEFFPGFGGSSRGLVARGTASLVTRSVSVMTSDTEWHVHDRKAWKWIADLVSIHGYTMKADLLNIHGHTIKAVQPPTIDDSQQGEQA